MVAFLSFLFINKIEMDELTIYKGYKPFNEELIDEVLGLLDFIVKNSKFDGFLDLYYFLSKYKNTIDFILENVALDEEEEQLSMQNFLRARLNS
jgi:hypothetical protein